MPSSGSPTTTTHRLVLRMVERALSLEVESATHCVEAGLPVVVNHAEVEDQVRHDRKDVRHREAACEGDEGEATDRDPRERSSSCCCTHRAVINRTGIPVHSRNVQQWRCSPRSSALSRQPRAGAGLDLRTGSISWRLLSAPNRQRRPENCIGAYAAVASRERHSRAHTAASKPTISR